jgi:hypothetical protein
VAVRLRLRTLRLAPAYRPAPAARGGGRRAVADGSAGPPEWEALRAFLPAGAFEVLRAASTPGELAFSPLARVDCWAYFVPGVAASLVNRDKAEAAARAWVARRPPTMARVVAEYFAARDPAAVGPPECGEEAGQAALLRCVFDNPFRPVTVAPAWLSWNGATVPKLAQAIYDERRFGDLPILADALEEASCDNSDVLAHCRSGGEHVRGCWVVDLLLGKA